MADVGKTLAEAIRRLMLNSLARDEALLETARTIWDGLADYGTVGQYAIRLGDLLSVALTETITADALPDGNLDKTLALEILRPVLREQHLRIANAAERVQTDLNRAAGLGLKAVRPELNRRRLDGLAAKLSSYGSFENAAWVLGEPIINWSQNVVDDAVRVNVAAHAAAGLHPRVERISDSQDCPWCMERAGIYAYPVDAEAYRRHERCRCLVLFTPRKEPESDRSTRILYAAAERKARDDRIQRVLDTEERIRRG